MPKTTTPNSTPSTAPVHTLAPKTKKWRVVDYVTTAVLGIAVGLVFWVLALSWKVLELAFQAFPPSIGLIAGLWVLAGPLAGAIIRKPGAALLCELIAAVVEAVLGSHFGATVLLRSEERRVGRGRHPVSSRCRWQKQCNHEQAMWYRSIYCH